MPDTSEKTPPRDRRSGFPSARWGWARALSRTKALELEASVWPYPPCLFEAHAEWTEGRDHAGLFLRFQFLGLLLGASLYDTRHWDERRGAVTPGCRGRTARPPRVTRTRTGGRP